MTISLNHVLTELFTVIFINIIHNSLLCIHKNTYQYQNKPLRGSPSFIFSIQMVIHEWKGAKKGAWLKLGRVAENISPNLSIKFIKNIKQIRAENPSLRQDFKLQAVEWSLKHSLVWFDLIWFDLIWFDLIWFA